MSAFSQGNNEEYLIHVIAVKHLLEQKGTIQDIGKEFKAVLEVRNKLKKGDLFKHMVFWNPLVMVSTATEYHK
jgi:hypothetical protein